MTVPGEGGLGRVDFGRSQTLLRLPGVSTRLDVRSALVCAALLTLTVVAGVLALATGSYGLSPSEVVAALAGRGTGLAPVVVLEWRLPRVLAGITFGAALGASGAVFQCLTRNPLASPDVLGFSAGAYSGALVVLIWTGGGFVLLASGALAGGLAAALAVYLLAYRSGIHHLRLIIVGIAISAMLASFNTWLMLTASLEVAMNAAVWGAGTLHLVTREQAIAASAVLVALIAVAAAAGPTMRQLELGDDASAAHGVRPERVRLALMTLGVALTAVATAAAGPILFVSLVAPQVARLLTRGAGVAVLPSACVGALMLTSADLVGRRAFGDSALPVGVVTVVLGGLYFTWLLTREARRRP